MSDKQPTDAQVKYCGQWYKFGGHGRLFVWRGDEWRLSMGEKNLVQSAIRKLKYDMQRNKRPRTKYKVTTDREKVDMMFP